MQKQQNVKTVRSTAHFHLFLGLYVLIKMYLRGVTSVSYAQAVTSQLLQTKIGSRVAVEIDDPIIGKYTVVAIRKTENTGTIVTAWKEESEDVSKRARQLLEVAYQVIFECGLSSWDIKREKSCLS